MGYWGVPGQLPAVYACNANLVTPVSGCHTIHTDKSIGCSSSHWLLLWSFRHSQRGVFSVHNFKVSGAWESVQWEQKTDPTWHLFLRSSILILPMVDSKMLKYLNCSWDSVAFIIAKCQIHDVQVQSFDDNGCDWSVWISHESIAAAVLCFLVELYASLLSQITHWAHSYDHHVIKADECQEITEMIPIISRLIVFVVEEWKPNPMQTAIWANWQIYETAKPIFSGIRKCSTNIRPMNISL